MEFVVLFFLYICLDELWDTGYWTSFFYLAIYILGIRSLSIVDFIFFTKERIYLLLSYIPDCVVRRDALISRTFIELVERVGDIELRSLSLLFWLSAAILSLILRCYPFSEDSVQNFRSPLFARLIIIFLNLVGIFLTTILR